MNIRLLSLLLVLSLFFIGDFYLIVKTWIFALFVCATCNISIIILKSRASKNMVHSYKKGDIVVLRSVGRYYERYIKCEVHSYSLGKNPFKKKVIYNLRSIERPDLTYRVEEKDIVGLYYNIAKNPKIKNRII